MDAARKYLALLELAENSETGRQAVRSAVIQAARRALKDVKDTRETDSPDDVICFLLNLDSEMDDSAWLEAFQRHLADIYIAGLGFPSNLN
jgi:hypothetical protein